MPKKIVANNKELIVVIILSSILTFIFLDSKPFYSKGEPREALVAQSMINYNNWVLPSRYGDEFATKPPFVHWLMAASAKITGKVDEVSARLPSAILSLLTVVIFFLFISLHSNKTTAFSTALLLITFIEWHRSSATARVDMTLSSMMVIALVSLFNWHKKNCSGFPIITIFSLSAAFLSKGPVALVLAVTIFTIFQLTDSTPKLEILKNIIKFSAPVSIIASLWYIAAYKQGGEVFVQTVLLENLDRFSGSMQAGDDPHSHSIWYLYGTLILGTVPGIFLIIFAIPSLLCHIPDKIKKLNFTNLNLWLNTQSPLFRYAVISVLTYLIFFSIPASKRSVYLLPIYPFLAYLLSLYVQFLYFTKPLLFKRGFSAVLIAIITICLSTAVFVVTSPDLFVSLIKSKRSLIEFIFYQSQIITTLNNLNLQQWIFILLAPLLATLTFIFSLIKNLKTELLILSTTASYVFLLITINMYFLPPVATALSAKHFAMETQELLPSEAKIYSYKMPLYGLNFYLKSKLYTLYLSEINNDEFYVVVENRFQEEFENLISNEFDYIILKKSEHPIERPNIFLSLYKLTRR